MSVYFTHPVRSPLEGSAFIDVSWHSTYSLLAVLAESRSPDRGMVFICHDEGELIADMCVERPHLAETISWHPERKILAIGWSSGEITTCNAYENEIFSVLSHHHSNVNIIRWSLTGNHIISADKSGLVLLWQIESKGELYSSPVHQTKVAGVVTHCVLLGADPKSSMRSTIASGLVTSILASKNGQLYLFNSSGHFIESEHLHAPVSHLVFSPETSFLAALTKGMSLVIFSTQNNSVHKHSEIAAKQFKSLGTNTMRKFSAELKPISYQAKFYTLNPRRSKPQSIDPARMLSAYGVKTLPQTQRQKSPLKSTENDKLHWSNTSIGPPEATKLKESSGSSSEGYLTASLELGDTESATGLTHDSASALRAQSMDSLFNGTSSQSVNHSPPEEATPLVVPPESGRDIKPPSIIRKIEEDEAPPIVPPRSGSLPNTLGHEYSTLEESPPTVLIKVSDEELSKKPNVRVPRPHMYESIEIFPQKSPPSSPGLPIRQETRGDRLAVREGSTEGEYDHLFPARKTHKSPIRRKKDANKESCVNDDIVVHSPLRRNESLPPMVFHSPVVRRRKTDDEDEDEQSLSDNTEDEEAPSPQPPIVFRVKKDSNSSEDPLADFLSVRTNLRWSQNLNPIYDNIKGMKISPAVAYEASSILAKQDQAIPEEGDHTPRPRGQTTEERESVSSDRRSSSGSGVETLVLVPDVPHCLTLPKRRPHNYEEVTIGPASFGTEDRPRFGSKGSRPLSDHYQSLKEVSPGMSDSSKYDDKSLTLSSPVRRLKSADTSQFISPRLNKRVITRRSKTVRSNDDFNAPHGRQHAQKVADTMKDFSFTNREYRVFYVKLPNGQLVSEVVNINRPVSILINKLAEQLGVTSSDIDDKWSMYVEGSILTTMKEAVLEFGEVQPAKAHVDRSVSLTQLVDSNSLADQGAAPILLKNSLSFRMQGITTSRILRLDDGDDSFANYCSVPITNEFHKKWLGVVQGNQPCTLESAVKLAAIQYQAYFLDRTAENSVVGFCRPNDFLPAEFAGVRGIEQKMYKEQEKIKSKNQGDIQKFYIKYCCSLPTNDTMFFPVREPRRKLFQSTRLKPVLLGVNKNGILRVCPKTKEVLDSWEYQVLKNWAYSRRTFVIAFNEKSYAVESNQARWISELVDFFVESIVQSSPPPQPPS